MVAILWKPAKRVNIPPLVALLPAPLVVQVICALTRHHRRRPSVLRVHIRLQDLQCVLLAVLGDIPPLVALPPALLVVQVICALTRKQRRRSSVLRVHMRLQDLQCVLLAVLGMLVRLQQAHQAHMSVLVTRVRLAQEDKLLVQLVQRVMSVQTPKVI